MRSVLGGVGDRRGSLGGMRGGCPGNGGEL